MNFLKQFKYHIAIITGLLIIILCLLFLINNNKNLNYQEYFENTQAGTDANTQAGTDANTQADTQAPSVPVLITDPIDAVSKNIRLKYTDVTGKANYLCVLDTATCRNYKTLDKAACISYSAGLQDKSNEFTSFKLSESLNPSITGYKLTSNLKDIQIPYPTLNKTDYETINFLCLNGTSDINDIFFKFEKNNNGKFRIKFTEKNKDYYVGLCTSKFNCQQSDKTYTTLCLYTDLSQAIYFDIELDDITKTTGKVCILYKFNK